MDSPENGDDRALEVREKLLKRRVLKNASALGKSTTCSRVKNAGYESQVELNASHRLVVQTLYHTDRAKV